MKFRWQYSLEDNKNDRISIIDTQKDSQSEQTIFKRCFAWISSAQSASFLRYRKRTSNKWDQIGPKRIIQYDLWYQHFNQARILIARKVYNRIRDLFTINRNNRTHLSSSAIINWHRRNLYIQCLSNGYQIIRPRPLLPVYLLPCWNDHVFRWSS